MSSQPQTMKALILDAPNRTANVQTVSHPTPSPGELLIRVHAIALNPVDSLYTFNPLADSGRTVGSDFAGTVVSTNALSDADADVEVTVGTRVAGFLQGACSRNERPGAFAEYLVCPRDLVWRVPGNMTFEEASAISLCGLTAAQALFERLGLRAPWSVSCDAEPREPKERFAFIYGASTSVTLYAAQLLHASAAITGDEWTLLGTSSPARFPILREKPYAYSHLISYRDPDWPVQIRALTSGRGVDIAPDCISKGTTVGDGASTLASEGKIAVLRSREAGAWDASLVHASIEPLYDAVWRGLGERVEYHSMILAASAESKAFAKAFYGWLSDRVKRG